MLLGLAAAVVIGVTLVAPVVLRGGATTCRQALTYAGRTYTPRPISDKGVVQAIAIGVGVTGGCGTQPVNVSLRSLTGVLPARAIGAAGDQTSLYVRRGLCGSASAKTLLACLKR